jgi:hypothetical protein
MDAQTGKYGNVMHVFYFYFCGRLIYVNIYVVVVYSPWIPVNHVLENVYPVISP